MKSIQPDDLIRIRGARQNNLVGVDVDLPRNALVAVTGVSGSGKSSLAFDTLYREGQRRFLETLSAYARQFLGGISRPDVESITGLSPAIAVDQRSISRGARSTVGTLTEITDHLRVLFARAGVAHSPWCGAPVESRTPESVVQELLRVYGGVAVQLAAPLVRDRKGQHRALLEDLRRKGFVRVRVDGEVQRIEEVPELARYKMHSIEVIVDRLKPSADNPGRLRESVDAALELGGGSMLVLTPDGVQSVSTQAVCPETGRQLPTLEPRLFSPNSPHGACPACKGLGSLKAPSERAVVADASLSIRAGALAVTRASGGALLFPRVDFGFLEQIAEYGDFSLDTPWCDLGANARRMILRGTGSERFEDVKRWQGKRGRGEWTWRRPFRGVLTELERAFARGTQRKLVARYLTTRSCPACEGSRLGEAARHVRLGGVTLPELCRLPVSELPARLAGLELNKRQARIARDLLAEVGRRLAFLEKVGLGYLSLERGADSLSGGEAQRIRLAAQLGAGLVGVLYVLDEPSIGLHARDHAALLVALRDLVDQGNSVVVVEHDESTLRFADWIVDVGPGAGRFGGRVVAQGPPEKVALADTPTGRLLRGEMRLPAPPQRRTGNGKFLRLGGACAFNLQNVDLVLPLGCMVAVTGVSGSGKSTLIQRTLRPAVLRALGRECELAGEYSQLRGVEEITDLVVVDSTPIGRTTRSNPATYTKVLGPIRDLFAALPESRVRGYGKSRFSFNVEGGRCEVCKGAGAELVELQFLAPVTVPCVECGGARFQAETLDILYRGHSISDVLAMTSGEALELFKDHPRIARPLQWMHDIGLGYLTLGQPSTTLSGGEAQRIKLVTHLQKRTHGQVLYLLDEPTTGLHMEDVGRLVGALQCLVDQGHTVVVIEHNLELIGAVDHVVDLGPEGGAGGGAIVISGTPEEVAACEDSHTGHALRSKGQAPRRARGKRRSPAPAPTSIELRGARTHNLCDVDVSIPHASLTVITGPSGSGKTSLALDTLHSEGRRRFVESLSTYARQFLGDRDRPPVESLTGLGPSVAVEAGTVGAHPRSTVATTTELHDHLRVLWARAGMPRCPVHGESLKAADPGILTRRWLKGECAGRSGTLLAPIFGHGRVVPADPTGSMRRLAVSWLEAGYLRALVDGKLRRLDALRGVRCESSLDLVIDRLALTAAKRSRLAEGVEQAASLAHGRVSFQCAGGPRLEASTSGACTQCGFQLDSALEPRHFSFNTHVGACELCAGLGETVVCDPNLLLTDTGLSLVDGAIGGKLGRYLTKGKGYYETLLRAVARSHRIDLNQPVQRMSPKRRDLLLKGVGARETYKVTLRKTTRNTEMVEHLSLPWTGLCGHVDAWHRKTDDPGWAALLESVMRKTRCPACDGERLAPGPRAVRLNRKRLPEILALSVSDALSWVRSLRLRAALGEVIAPVIDEVRGRLSLLEKVGLGYLTLDRSTATLSGGEARRVRLSASLGSELVGVCYVLDEPTVGLHPADVDSLCDALCSLRDRGNTVIVVEHDGALMARADWIVDMGPGAGRLGGRLVAAGTPAQIAAHKHSSTAAYLRGELGLPAAVTVDRDPSAQAPIRLRGARVHNLKGLDLDLDFGRMIGVCGPSGSGKSSLVLDTLLPALLGEEAEGRWKDCEAPENLRVVVVDATPIGRTPHSVPATYTGLMGPLRELFARTPAARQLGMGPAHFSFNSTRGRCPACDGRGVQLVEMQFLADLWLTCDECDGLRYKPEVLEVRHRGLSMADVLALSVDEAAEYLMHHPKCVQILGTLQRVGLGYLGLGQASTTLSGGEAQRMKLASELARLNQTNCVSVPSLIVLDEPTTGLSASDCVQLHAALRALTDQGHAVVLIEHHTDLLASCDGLVELGPEGGDAGGRVIARGTPAELEANKDSLTGPFLRKLRKPLVRPARASKRRVARNHSGRSRRVGGGVI
jgi:excinuclease ABC subunit A